LTFDQGDGEIRNANVTRETELPGIRQRAQRLRQRHMRIGPVQQQQVDVGHAQADQAFFGGAFEIVRSEMRGPDLGGHKHLVAADSRCAQALADLPLVLIDLRGIDMAVTEFQRLLDDARATAAAQLPGAKPDRRDLCAVSLDELHEFNTLTDPAALCRAGSVLPTELRDHAKFTR
jgi:hypothetical protein